MLTPLRAALSLIANLLRTVGRLGRKIEPNHTGRNAYDRCLGGNMVDDNGPCPHNAVVADGDMGNGTGTDPHQGPRANGDAASQMDARGDMAMAVNGVVVFDNAAGVEDDIITNHATRVDDGTCPNDGAVADNDIWGNDGTGVTGGEESGTTGGLFSVKLLA